MGKFREHVVNELLFLISANAVIESSIGREWKTLYEAPILDFCSPFRS